jgi:hypothetical protein
VDIRSTPSGYSPKTQTGRAREANAPAAPRPGTPPAAPSDETKVDRVEISAAAIELNARLARAESTGGLSPERIRQLAGRMNDGYYDQPATIDRILEGVRAEITRGDSRA